MRVRKAHTERGPRRNLFTMPKPATDEGKTDATGLGGAIDYLYLTEAVRDRMAEFGGASGERLEQMENQYRYKS